MSARLEGFPAAQITLNDSPEDTYKNYGRFIIALIRDGSQEKWVARAGSFELFERHRLLVEALIEEARKVGLTSRETDCWGGGRFFIDSESKKLYLWDKSDDYGTEPERKERTTKLFTEIYPDLEILLKTPDETGPFW